MGNKSKEMENNLSFKITKYATKHRNPLDHIGNMVQIKRMNGNTLYVERNLGELDFQIDETNDQTVFTSFLREENATEKLFKITQNGDRIVFKLFLITQNGNRIVFTLIN
jgi:hypothetical protein